MGLGVRYMNLATDVRIGWTMVRRAIATVTWFLATDGHVATVVQMGLGAPLLKADLGARKNGVHGAAVGQRGNARGGYEAIGREHIVALVFPNASDPSNIICTFVYLFAFICLFA